MNVNSDILIFFLNGDKGTSKIYLGYFYDPISISYLIISLYP